MEGVFVASVLLIFASCSVHANSDYEYVDDKAEKLISIPCDNDDDCLVVNAPARCVNSVCTCPNGNDCPVPNIKVLIKLNETCENTAQCHIENAVCFNGKCSCESGYITSNNSRACLSTSLGIGYDCIEDAQCLATYPNTRCHAKICQCIENMHDYSDFCYQNIDLDHACSSSINCSHIQNTICKENICSCNEKSVRSGNKCLLKAGSYFSICSENIQCTVTLGAGSLCLNNFCHCNDLYQFQSTTNKCVRDILLGEICANHTECHQPGPGPSRLECVLGECKCKPPYHYEEGICISAASMLSVSSFKWNFIYICLVLFVYHTLF